MCYPENEFVVGCGDVLLGEVEGSPFSIVRHLDQAWGETTFLLDVAAGGPEGFSLPSGFGGHFVTRSAGCVSESITQAGGVPARVVFQFW